MRIQRLTTLPGSDVVTAWTIVAEMGVDMAHFADADHAVSWAGLVPGSYESAGKRKSSRTIAGCGGRCASLPGRFRIRRIVS